MIKKLLRQAHNEHEKLRKNKYYKKLIGKIAHSNHFGFSRQSVTRGVAAGLLVCLIPLPIQTISSLIVALIIRGNLIIAMICTWVSNPFTFIPLNIIILRIGFLVTGQQTTLENIEAIQWNGKSFSEMMYAATHIIERLGEPFITGLIVTSVILSITGYAVVYLLWGYLAKHLKHHHKPRKN